MSTVAIFQRPRPSSPKRIRMGSRARQGPHHLAPNSTSTGTSDASTSLENVSSSTYGILAWLNDEVSMPEEVSNPRSITLAESV